MEEFCKEELAPDAIDPLLGEATWEQIYSELCRRYSHFIFAGVPSYPWEQGLEEHAFITAAEGSYLMRRGLQVAVGEHIDDESAPFFLEGDDDDRESATPNM